MGRFKCVLSALLLLPMVGLAQSGVPRTEKAQSVNFNIIGLQYNYETPVSRLATVNFHGGLGSDFRYEQWNWGSGSHSEWGITVRGVAGADLRYFYNLDRRARKGKTTERNTGNFLSLDLTYISPAIYSRNIETENVVMLLPAYGLRRVFRSGWLIEARAGLGIGVEIDSNNWGATIKADFKVGYSF